MRRCDIDFLAPPITCLVTYVILTKATGSEKYADSNSVSVLKMTCPAMSSSNSFLQDNKDSAAFANSTGLTGGFEAQMGLTRNEMQGLPLMQREMDEKMEWSKK